VEPNTCAHVLFVVHTSTFSFFAHASLGSFDHRVTHHQSAGSHDPRPCSSTPLGCPVCSTMCPQISSRFLCSAYRQSQLASQGPVALAEKLTQSLRDTGDLELVQMDLQSYVVTSRHVCTYLNPSATESQPHPETRTRSCFRPLGVLNLLNRSCSSFVHATS
jgi:hypothetical protein